MISYQSHFQVIDNSGARTVKAFGFLSGRSQPAPATSLVVSVKKYFPNRKVKKGEIYRALVVSLKNPPFRLFEDRFSFDYNGVVLLKKGDPVPLANRLRGSVFIELRRKGFSKISSLSWGVV